MAFYIATHELLDKIKQSYQSIFNDIENISRHHMKTPNMKMK